MGVVSAIRDVVKGGGAATVEEARHRVARLEAEVRGEVDRIAGAEAAIEEASERLRSSDPDADSKGFAKLVQERDAGRGRLEAHHARHGRMVAELATARAELTRIEVSAKVAEVAEVDAKIRALDTEILADAKAFVSRTEARIQQLREAASRAVLLEREANAAAGAASAFLDPSRGSPWALPDGSGVLQKARQLIELEYLRGGRP